MNTSVRPPATIPLSKLAKALLDAGGVLLRHPSFLSERDAKLLHRLLTEANPDVVITRYLVSLRPRMGMGVTYLGWTDRHPCEVVAVAPTGLWCDIRPMKAEGGLKKDAKFIPGGFVGHYVDQHNAQEWTLISNPTASTRRIRLCKHGWRLRAEKYFMGHAMMFHDYNF